MSIEVSSPPTPIYEHIAGALRQDIRRGVYAQGQQVPTEAELIERYGVSRITARRALQELINEGLLVGRKGLGTFVNTAKFAVSPTFLLVHADDFSFNYPYTALIMHGINRFSQATQCFRLEMLPMPRIEEQAAGDRTVLELALQGRVDGVLSLARVAADQLQRLVENRIPTVMIGGSRVIDVPEGVATIDTGMPTSLSVACEHLRATDRKRVGILTITGEASPVSSHHAHRVEEAFHQVGLPFDPARLERSSWGINAGIQAATQLLHRCPDLDAIVAADDMLALGAMHAVVLSGRRIKDDVAIIGQGNLMGEHSHGELSTVDVRLVESGQIAMRTLHRMVQQEPIDPCVRLEAQLIRRQSS